MKLNASNFVEKATTFHNGKYTYDNCVYIKSTENVIVTCKLHGDFNVTPKNHLRGGYCPVCKKPSVHTTEAFIKRAAEVHNYQYTYDNAIFKTAATKTMVTCKYHGNFSVSPNNHLRGKGCPLCALTKRGWNRTIYKNTHTILYLVKINKLLYKVGITKKTIKERYSKDTKFGNTIEVLKEYHFLEGTDAYDLEKIILLNTTNNKYIGPDVLVHGGNSELRTENCADLMEHYVKELNENNRHTM